jgi:hypothetical protein
MFNLSVVPAATFLAPGATDEPGNSDEIEIDVDLRDTRGEGAATFDDLTLNAGFPTTPVTLRLGTIGGVGYANLNAAEATGIDEDVSFRGIRDILFGGGYGNDDVQATGGLGTAFHWSGSPSGFRDWAATTNSSVANPTTISTARMGMIS